MAGPRAALALAAIAAVVVLAPLADEAATVSAAREKKAARPEHEKKATRPEKAARPEHEKNAARPECENAASERRLAAEPEKWPNAMKRTQDTNDATRGPRPHHGGRDHTVPRTLAPPRVRQLIGKALLAMSGGAKDSSAAASGWTCYGFGAHADRKHATPELQECDAKAAAAIDLPPPAAVPSLRHVLSADGAGQLDALLASTPRDLTGTVTVVFAAYAHVHVLLNWVYAVNGTFGAARLDSVVVVCGDMRIATLLRSVGKACFYEPQPEFAKPAPNAYTQNRMGMMQHAELIRAAVAMDFLAHGADVLITDVDAVPINADPRILGPGPALSSVADIIASQGMMPGDVSAAWGGAGICCGWFWLRGGEPRVLDMLNRTFSRFFQLTPKDGQVAINKVLHGDKPTWYAPPELLQSDLFGWAVFDRTGVRLALLSQCVVGRLDCGQERPATRQYPRPGGCLPERDVSVVHCQCRNGHKSAELKKGGVWHLDTGFGKAFDKVDSMTTQKAPSCKVLYDTKCHLPQSIVEPLNTPSSGASVPALLETVRGQSWRGKPSTGAIFRRRRLFTLLGNVTAAEEDGWSSVLTHR